MPNVGDIAPEFELMTQDHSRKVKLSDLRGKTVVPLFYPMDFLPVCTTEHCSFTAAFGQIALVRISTGGASSGCACCSNLSPISTKVQRWKASKPFFRGKGFGVSM